jgi:hypothetical protein
MKMIDAARNSAAPFDIGLLRDKNIQAFLSSGHGGIQSRGSAAYDGDIRLKLEHLTHILLLYRSNRPSKYRA